MRRSARFYLPVYHSLCELQPLPTNTGLRHVRTTPKTKKANILISQNLNLFLRTGVDSNPILLQQATIGANPLIAAKTDWDRYHEGRRTGVYSAVSRT